MVSLSLNELQTWWTFDAWLLDFPCSTSNSWALMSIMGKCCCWLIWNYCCCSKAGTNNYKPVHTQTITIYIESEVVQGCIMVLLSQCTDAGARKQWGFVACFPGIRATYLAFCTRKQREIPAIFNVQPLAFPSVCSLEKEEPLPFVPFLLFSQLTVSQSLFTGGFGCKWLICCCYCIFTVFQPSACTLDCQGETGTDVSRCHCSIEKQSLFKHI